MVQEVEVKVWCDAHHLKGEQVAGRTLVLTTTGAQREIDLCSACVETFVEPLAELLKVAGRPVAGAPAKAPAKVPAKRPPGHQGGRPRAGETPEQAAERRRREAARAQGDQALDLGDLTAPATAIASASAVIVAGGLQQADGSVQCPLCTMVSANGMAWRQHLKHTHSSGLVDMFGLTCPVCEASVDRSLGQHTGAAHGVDLVGAYDLALAQGDPHGRAAELRTHWQELAATAA